MCCHQIHFIKVQRKRKPLMKPERKEKEKKQSENLVCIINLNVLFFLFTEDLKFVETDKFFKEFTVKSACSH